MPHILISTQVRLESGPCTVGDESSDPELMRYLGAKLIKQLGNNFLEWRTELVPRVVLDRLERRGYRLEAMTGVGQTCIWTMRREMNEAEKQLTLDEEERHKRIVSNNKNMPNDDDIAYIDQSTNGSTSK